jgi:hypothetical protein
MPLHLPLPTPPLQGGPREHSDSEYQWVSPDEATVLPFARDFSSVIRIAARYDLAISGDALSFLENIGMAAQVIPLCQVGTLGAVLLLTRARKSSRLWPRTTSLPPVLSTTGGMQVFARVSPEQKELVLVTLKDAGRTTLMCGDGTNDVGGLKAAHVGVALLSASEAVEKVKAASGGRQGGLRVFTWASLIKAYLPFIQAMKAKRAEKEAKEAAKAIKDASKSGVVAPPLKAGMPSLPPLPDAPGDGPGIPDVPGPIAPTAAIKATDVK